MYEYLDRPPQVGDVVEWIGDERDLSQYMTVGKLYIITSKFNADTSGVTNDKGEENDIWVDTCFKVVKTKPHTKMKAGDHFIRIKAGKHLIDTVYIYTAYYGAEKSETYLYYDTTKHILVKEAVVLCKAEEKPMNPFKVGDRVRCVDNPTSTRKIDDEFTIIKIEGTDVYYKDGFAAHYKNFKLVSRAEPDTSIKVGSHWQEMYTSTSKGPIVKITKTGKDTVQFEELTTCESRYKTLSDFLYKFIPRPDLDKPQLLHQKWKDLYDQGVELEWKWDYESIHCHRPISSRASMFTDPFINYRIKPSVQKTVEPTKQQKEQTMNNLDLKLLLSIMAAMAASEEVTKDATNSEYVCIMTKHNEYEGYFYVDSIDEANKVMQSPEHEGKKLHIFKYESTIAQKPRKVIAVDRV